MERGARIELALSAWKAEILPLNEPRKYLVPLAGIEPTHPAYKTGPLPLRIKGQKNSGGEYQIRTDRPLLAKQMLYQMS